jgi:hypothetical protein
MAWISNDLASASFSGFKVRKMRDSRQRILFGKSRYDASNEFDDGPFFGRTSLSDWVTMCCAFFLAIKVLKLSGLFLIAYM